MNPRRLCDLAQQHVKHLRSVAIMVLLPDHGPSYTPEVVAGGVS